MLTSLREEIFKVPCCVGRMNSWGCSAPTDKEMIISLKLQIIEDILPWSRSAGRGKSTEYLSCGERYLDLLTDYHFFNL